MKRGLGAAGLLLLIAACDRKPEATSPPLPTASAAPAAKPAAPDPASLFFVGRWATRPELCADKAWVITAQALDTAGETHCRFEGAPEGAGPVEIDAVCTAEGPPKTSRLRFSYAQSARALLVEHGPFADAGLIRCPGPAYPEATPKPPGSPGALPDDRTPVSEKPFTATSAQGAANVVQSYFALIEAGRYPQAWRLWSDGGRASGADAGTFAKGFAEYDSHHALIGAPGEIEGAAGSLYVEVPVQIYGRRKDGVEVHRLGTVTLRRVNDVPGSTPEQRRWHIQKIEAKDVGP